MNVVGSNVSSQLTKIEAALLKVYSEPTHLEHISYPIHIEFCELIPYLLHHFKSNNSLSEGKAIEWDMEGC